MNVIDAYKCFMYLVGSVCLNYDNIEINKTITENKPKEFSLLQMLINFGHEYIFFNNKLIIEYE